MEKGKGCYRSHVCRQVDFSLWLKNSDHVTTFFVALRFWLNTISRDAIPLFFPRPKIEKNLKKSFQLLLISLDKAFPGLPIKALAGYSPRQHRFVLFSLCRATENGVRRSVFSKNRRATKNVVMWSECFNRGLKSMVFEVGWRKALVPRTSEIDSRWLLDTLPACVQVHIYSDLACTFKIGVSIKLFDVDYWFDWLTDQGWIHIKTHSQGLMRTKFLTECNPFTPQMP